VLWKEVRIQRKGRGMLPKAPRIEDSADHYAEGLTAATSDAFQGRHEAAVLIIFDEATGVDAQFWEGAESMLTSPNCYFLAICNPTDTSSRAYEAEQSGRWHVITVSAMDHPNIVAELAGQPAPIPSAVRLEWVRARVEEWCERVAPGDERPGDIEFEGATYRPGPLFESRVLGMWPSQGSLAVWSDAAWQAAVTPKEIDSDERVQVGCDVARFGDDFTSIMVRRGNCALHFETHNGWDTAQTAGRLKQICREYDPNDPKHVLCAIDDDGVGGGVTDQRDGYRFIGCSGANRALTQGDYPNRRSESWFSVVDRAKEGRVDLSRLPPSVLSALRRQCMAPKWKLDNQGRRVVEPKDETKKRIGRSPDDADTLNLCFGYARPAFGGGGPVRVGLPVDSQGRRVKHGDGLHGEGAGSAGQSRAVDGAQPALAVPPGFEDGPDDGGWQ
jgi:hypothetical protein